MMLGLLLARAGIETVVLEKHADFFRDFRGDTIHPSTLQVMGELGLLDRLLAIPHSNVAELTARIGGRTLRIADFGRIPGRCKFIAFMPQWDFLNLLAQQAHSYPTFSLLMQTEAFDLVREGERVAGVRARTPQGEATIDAGLVVACDGRHSVLRERARLDVVDVGAPIDALWMRVSRNAGDPQQTFGTVAAGGMLIAIDRGEYYQCAFVIRKGGFEAIRARGIDAFRDDVGALAPFLRGRLGEIRTWSDVKLLTVMVDRLRRWYVPGLLCIGDAAHAMSPVGGVGINLAVQDAVAAANALSRPLLHGPAGVAVLRAIQRRRELPARLTQMLQVQVQSRFLSRALCAQEEIAPPAAALLLDRCAPLRRTVARVVGFGFRPEHVRTSGARTWPQAR